MPKIIERWLLFTYIHGEFTPLSKPFKMKAEAEKARLKLPERERRSVAVGVIRTKRKAARLRKVACDTEENGSDRR